MNKQESLGVYSQQKYAELWDELKSNLQSNKFILEKQAEFEVNIKLDESEIITMYTDLVFNGALYIYDQALRSYEFGVYEAAAVMCRTAIESALYEAITRKLQLRGMSVAINNGTVLKGRRHEPVEYYWNDLINGKEIAGEHINGAIEIGILSESEATEIRDSIIDKGNFSAHFSERVDAEFYKSSINTENSKEYKAKIRTSKGEVEEILNTTRNWLIKIIKGYFDNP